MLTRLVRDEAFQARIEQRRSGTFGLESFLYISKPKAFGNEY